MIRPAKTTTILEENCLAESYRKRLLQLRKLCAKPRISRITRIAEIREIRVIRCLLMPDFDVSPAGVLFADNLT